MSKKYSDAELTLIYHEVESKGGNAHLYRGRLWLPQDVQPKNRPDLWRIGGVAEDSPEGDTLMRRRTALLSGSRRRLD